MCLVPRVTSTSLFIGSDLLIIWPNYGWVLGSCVQPSTVMKYKKLLKCSSFTIAHDADNVRIYRVGVKYLMEAEFIMGDHQGFFDENCSPEECLERIQSLFNDENTNPESSFDLQYLDQLLMKLHSQNPEFHLINKRVASFVRDVATFYPDAVCHLLLIHLPDLSDPIPFVDIMASLFCFAAPSLVVEAFKHLKLLLKRDNRLLLPVLMAMSDLPLPDNLLQELCIFAEDAINILDEVELPALFRTLLRSLCPSRAERAILKLRDEVRLQ